MSWTQIKIKHIPAIFPDMNFQDIKIVEQRLRMLPDAQKEIFETAEKHKTITRPYVSNNLKIQSIYRNKYELQFFFKENTNVDIIKIAGTCEVVLSDLSILDLYVLSIDYEKTEGTNNYHATITFYILDEDYKSINSYLIYNSISDLYADNDLNRITFFSNKTISAEFTGLGDEYTVYSIVTPKYLSSEIKEKNTDQSGIEYASNSIDFKLLNYLAYLTENEAIIVKRYLPRCQVGYNLTNGLGNVTTSIGQSIVTSSIDNNLVAGQWIRIGNEIREILQVTAPKTYLMKTYYDDDYTNSSFSFCDIGAVERINPVLDSKEMVDCYECKISVKYNQIDFDNFN